MYLPHSCLLLFLLLASAPCLVAQQTMADNRKVQFAYSIRYGEGFSGGPNFEPPQTGQRQLHGFLFEQELEVRFSQKWSALFSLGGANTKTWRSPEAQGNVFVEDPEFITHPYSSELTGLFVQLGGQYSHRIGSGDLSLALTSGFIWNTYSREYDRITLDGQSYVAAGTLRDRTKSATSVLTIARLQYTYWFSRQLAVSIGVQYLSPSYLSGGIDTPRGVRYELDAQGSSRILVPFDVNYDITSLTPDPSVRRNRFNWLVGFTSRI
ncbi:MAG: hypothetical protein AAF597_08790 [Bacteroidota bacterium]